MFSCHPCAINASFSSMKQFLSIKLSFDNQTEDSVLLKKFKGFWRNFNSKIYFSPLVHCEDDVRFIRTASPLTECDLMRRHSLPKPFITQKKFSSWMFKQKQFMNIMWAKVFVFPKCLCYQSEVNSLNKKYQQNGCVMTFIKLEWRKIWVTNFGFRTKVTLLMTIRGSISVSMHIFTDLRSIENVCTSESDFLAKRFAMMEFCDFGAIWDKMSFNDSFQTENTFG